MADVQKQELIRKVRALVTQRFAGNYKRAFDHYAKKRRNSGLIDRDELLDVLTDAGVGNFATRGAWADGIMRELDKDHDGFIAYSEFQWMEQSA